MLLPRVLFLQSQGSLRLRGHAGITFPASDLRSWMVHDMSSLTDALPEGFDMAQVSDSLFAGPVLEATSAWGKMNLQELINHSKQGRIYMTAAAHACMRALKKKDGTPVFNATYSRVQSDQDLVSDSQHTWIRYTPFPQRVTARA